MGVFITAEGVRTPQGPSVGEVLAWATALLTSAGVESPRLDAECLLASLLGCDRLHLYAVGDGPLPSRVLDGYRTLIARRHRREPLAYLTGTKEFWSLPLQVTPAVLIPRPETEVLVETALTRLTGRQAPVAADIGCGSGAIAVAIAKTYPCARIYATEMSRRALAIARENAGAHKLLGVITFLQGDLLEPLFARGLAGRCDVIVSNPPYVTRGELAALPPEVHYEPVEALDGGVDGLDLHRRIIRGTSALLRPGGWLALEMAPGQGGSLAGLLRDEGTFTDVASVPDLSGRQRVIVARCMGPGGRGHNASGASADTGTAWGIHGA
ncbi:MAG: peptide chain release factor N(5)-glutamine methyltransferase [Candidatus Methylomirabilales bacterium]